MQKLAVIPALMLALLARPPLKAQDDGGGEANRESTAAAQPKADPDSDPRPLWSKADAKERTAVLEMLESRDWPFRAIGLMRLEAYRISGSNPQGNPQNNLGFTPLLGERLHDKAWQVRCFAIHQAKPLGVAVTPSDLANEVHPRVLRTALRHGIAISPEVIRPIATPLLKARSLEQQLLGIELAAATHDEALHAQAGAVVKAIALRVDRGEAAYISRRLSRVIGLKRPLTTPDDWRRWINLVRGEVRFPPIETGDSAGDALEGIRALDGGSIFREMEADTFARLIDYLKALRQRDLDVAMVMDATNSMEPMIDEARVGANDLIRFLTDISRAMRLGFIAYRDNDNPPVWEGVPLTDSIEKVQEFLFALQVTGGADFPEAVYDGLAACNELRWNKEAERQIIVIGDAPPHEADHARLQKLLEHFDEHNLIVHTLHVPMKWPEEYLAQLTPQLRERQERFLIEYNRATAKAFREIAQFTGGDSCTIEEAEDLVPSVMHFTIDRGWWEAFDAFYALYVDLCS